MTSSEGATHRFAIRSYATVTAAVRGFTRFGIGLFLSTAALADAPDPSAGSGFDVPLYTHAAAARSVLRRRPDPSAGSGFDVPLYTLRGATVTRPMPDAGAGSGFDVPLYTESATRHRQRLPDPSAGSGFDVPLYTLGHRANPALGAARAVPRRAPTAAQLVADEAWTNPARSRLYTTWLERDGLSSNGQQLLAQLQDARVHGLDPNAYQADGLIHGMRAVFGAPVAHDRPDSAARAALAYRFRRAFSDLATDLGRGVVDAQSTQRNLFREPPPLDTSALHDSIARGDMNVDEALGSITPTSDAYRRLTERMRELMSEQASARTRQRVDETGSSTSGPDYDDVMRIKRRLIETGDLPDSHVLTPLFDSELEVAVRTFQTRNGIEPDGIIGKRTRLALNRTVDEDMDELALSLERWRWMPRDLGERHVFVNLPAYQLQLNNGSQRIVDMPVVIGTTEYKTPSFSRDMSYMEFNPTWTVPASIANRELIPNERRNAGYLAARNFEILDEVNGQYVPIAYADVSPRDLAMNPFPYTLRQRGGGNNALGRMKFMMPNPYAIYLHDTPAKQHFKLNERAYSHGCIRLSDPDRLASLLMQIDGKSHADVDRALSSPVTQRVRLNHPVPTHLAYFTSWVDESGAVQRRADVYGYDAKLREALRLHRALPSRWSPAVATSLASAAD